MTARVDDDDDFILRDERPARRRRAPSSSRRGEERGWSLLALVTKRPGRTIIGAAASALLTGIAVNALVLQKEKHPAPLFVPAEIPSQPAPAPARTHAAALAPAPAVQSPASDVTSAGTTKDLIGNFITQGSTAKLTPPSSQPVPAMPRSKDPLGALIRNSGVDRQHAGNERVDTRQKDSIAALIKSNAPADVAAPPTEAIAAAQHALVRLGFVLRADGVWGASSKQAIELFERDHGLPADSNLSPRVTKQLSQLSGVSIP
jgi:hypothetical protein